MKNLIILFLLVSFTGLFGQTFNTIKSGDWSDNTIWASGQVPNLTSGKWSGSYQVNINHDVTHTGSFSFSGYSALQVAENASLEISGNIDVTSSSQADTVLFIHGTLGCSDFKFNSSATSVTHTGDLIAETVTFQNGHYELDGVIQTDDLRLTNSGKLVASGAFVAVDGNLTSSGGGFITLDDSFLDITGTYSSTGSFKTTLTGGSLFSVDAISLKGNADIIGSGDAGNLYSNSFTSNNNSAAVICAAGGSHAKGDELPTSLDLSDCSNAVALAILPVEWGYVRAEIINQRVALNWATEVESGNAYFEVQRSTNEGLSWETIGEVMGAGDTQETTHYNYLDAKIAGLSSIYYRLKQVDFDGAYEYSPMVAVNQSVSAQNVIHLTVYPNPASEYFQLELPTGSALRSVAIFDQLGRVQHTFTTTKATVDHFHIPQELSNGTYFLRIETNHGSTTQALQILR